MEIVMKGVKSSFTIGNSSRLLCVIVLLLFLSPSVEAQKKAVDSSRFFNPITDNIIKRLPPLSVLIDSAAYNSPDMHYQDLKAQYYYYEQLSAQRAWLEHLSLNLDMNLGKWNFWDRDEITKRDRYYRSESIRDNYAVGFYIRFPLASIFDRRNRIKKQKKWIEIALTQKEINRRFLAKEVIDHYNNLVQYQNYIRIYNDYQSFTMMQMQMAQNEFLNGEISTAEYTRLKEIQTRGAVNYQQAIAEFNKEYQLLEVTTGMKFNLINILR
jgi:outer membrane protein TolC